MDPKQIGEVEAGELLVEMLLGLLYAGNLSAKSVALICFWAGKAGAKGPVAAHGFHPGAQSGHYQRHLDSVLGINMKVSYIARSTLAVPQHCKHDFSRTPHKMLLNAPHEKLGIEMQENPEVLAELRRMRASKALPPAYWEHPVVRRSEKPVLPCVLYLDGAPFSKRDGQLAILVYNLVSLKRHCVAMFRRSNLCKCGCRGWCSMFPVFEFIRHSFEALAEGRYPEAKCDGSDWGPGEERRRASANTQVAAPCCLLQIRGDWAEFAHSLGFTTWNSVFFPCMLCRVVKDEMHDLSRPFDPLHFPADVLTQADMEKAVAVAEIEVKLTTESWSLIKAALAYDRRKEGGRGRCLTTDLPSVGLKAGDRLEPSRSLMDVGEFESLRAPFPTVVFWRRAAETRMRHRNPIFSQTIGVSIDNIAIDLLHTIYLGVCLDFGARCVWACFGADIYRIGPGKTTEEIESMSLMRLRTDLLQFYKDFHKENPDTCITQVEDITAGMFGSKAKPMLKLKGLEAKGFVFFLVPFLKRFSSELGAAAGPLIAAGEALLNMFSVFSDCGIVLPTQAVQKLHDSGKRFLFMAKAGGVALKPKAHLLLHLIARARVQGNPSWYATMADEGNNAVLAGIARCAHRSVWEARVLEYYERLVDLKRKRA